MTPDPVQASVIIPAFNAGEYIAEQLLALARQRTGVSWELILADNGSTDQTPEIVQRIAPQISAGVRVVDASAVRGRSAALNSGAAVAAGELLLFADADDVVDELWVDEMVRALRKHPFVGGRVETLELNGEIVASWRVNFFDSALPTVNGIPWVSGANFGCTAAAYAAVGGCDETNRAGEDIDLSLRMHAHGMTAVFAERAIVHYRFRRDPLQAARQVWGYGRSRKALYELHGVEPPTFLDTLVRSYRDAKQAARDLLRRRWPVPPALDLAFVLGEASTVWRRREFWHPVTRIVEVKNPLIVQRDRLGRLGRTVAQVIRVPRG